MKRSWLDIILALLFGVILPWTSLEWIYEHQSNHIEQSETLILPTGTQDQEYTIPVYISDEDKIVYMSMNDYLTGVLLCEIPASFHMEAKKAQAVVARTYALKTIENGVKHTPSAVCTESACCQGYTSEEDYLKNGGKNSAIEHARMAVQETDPYVITYNGRLIDATYFSCSGGTTEDAVAVWGSDIPYLQAVESPGEEDATHYMDTVIFSSEDFQILLERRLDGQPKDWFKEVIYTEGGGVDTIKIGEFCYKGTVLRQKLGLRSTMFRIQTEGDRIIITTKGFGHRVGMSQFGANAMAENGCGFHQILSHYYTGTEIDKVEDLG